MVRLDEVAVGYNRKVIIDGIELEIEAGEVVTLIGPNGSGKSTILKSVIGQLPLVAGKTYIADKAVKDMSASEMARLTSVVMTDRVRTELMTCREVVANGRYPYTNKMGFLSKEDWNKVDAAIARVVLSNIRKNSQPDSKSGGINYQKGKNLYGLTEREMEVLALLVEGLKNPQISKKLVITIATTKTHVHNILQKLYVKTRSKAVATAMKDGLV